MCKHFTHTSQLQSMRLFTCYVINALMALCEAKRNPGRRVVAMFDLTNSGLANIDVACLMMILVSSGQEGPGMV